MKKLIQYITIFVSVFVLYSCSEYREYRVLKELKALCKKDAGLSVYRTVNTDGYYDATRKNGAIRTLIQSPYKYVEYCNLEPSYTSVFKEPGCWYVEKIVRADGKECNKEIDKLLHKVDVNGYPEFRKNQCLKVKKVEKIQSKYGHYFEVDRWHDKNGISKFTKSRSYIKDINNNDLLMELVSYRVLIHEHSMVSKNCYKIDRSMSPKEDRNFVEKTLISRYQI